MFLDNHENMQTLDSSTDGRRLQNMITYDHRRQRAVTNGYNLTTDPERAKIV